MEDGFHLNIARYENRKAWNSRPEAPVYMCMHFAHVYLGRDRAAAMEKAQEFKGRFFEGTTPGAFKLDLTEWRATGMGVEI